MRQRGRPPHPDILTPREWEVLSLLREGLSNREIGDRLGLTRDGVKYHVSQILLKLGVATREEAAAWHPAAPVEAAPANRFAARLSGVSRLGLIGAAGVILVGVAALTGAVAYNEIAGGGSSTNPADVSAGGPPTASPGPYGVPTPTPFGTPVPPASGGGNNSLGFVAYVRDGNLWILNLDTGEDRIIVQREIALTFGTTAADLTAFNPEWSADGQWVSFCINDAANDYKSGWIVRSSDSLVEFGGGGDGSDWSPVDLTLFGAGELFRPVGSFGPDFAHYANSSFVTNVAFGEAKWSPDGARLAAASANTSYIGQTGKISVNPPYAVKIIDPQSARPSTAPQGSDPAGVTTIYSADDGPGPPVIHSWSPDGKYIIFWRGVAPTVGTNADIALVSVDNPSDVKTIGQSRVVPQVAAWSPDGSRLVLASGDSKSIEVLSEDGTVQAHLGGEDSASVEPAWSPGGDRIAFAKSGGIWTAAKDGSGLSQLTTDRAYYDRYPQWSRDGSRIVFVRLSADAVVNQVAGPAELWIMNADGSDAHKIGDLPSINLQTQALGGFDVDWTQYLSWYRPSGIAPLPLRTASPPSVFPSFPPGATPLANPLGTKPPPGR